MTSLAMKSRTKWRCLTDVGDKTVNIFSSHGPGRASEEAASRKDHVLFCALEILHCVGFETRSVQTGGLSRVSFRAENQRHLTCFSSLIQEQRPRCDVQIKKEKEINKGDRMMLCSFLARSLVYWGLFCSFFPGSLD